MGASLINARKKVSGASTNPIIAIGGLVAWWDRDGIDPSATVDGNNVDTWTDRIGSRVLNKVTGTQPTLEVSASKRAVQFGGNSALRIAEWAAVDFEGRVDPFTIIVKTGADPGTIGTLIGKQLNGSDNIQYQLAISSPNGTTNGKFHHNIASGTNIGGTPETFSRYVVSSPPLVGNKVYSVAVGTASNNDVNVYYDNEVPSEDLSQAFKIGTHTNNHDIYVGARWAGSGDNIGFQFDGSIAHVLIFDKKLTASEVSTVVSNLD